MLNYSALYEKLYTNLFYSTQHPEEIGHQAFTLELTQKRVGDRPTSQYSQENGGFQALRVYLICTCHKLSIQISGIILKNSVLTQNMVCVILRLV
ncbi:hypothetical protein GCM10010911_03410 [Paenibacillus nasutitermitis]|uniref:Uncharacterized protein n=1 Tax=Paenibacillus nasutitermitis TaxID=1652958 RepID=A0A917DMB9_9BACL|nr:hypothetical protein GCM10010911_03410 [Paenibacillus nasutitermitis]